LPLKPTHTIDYGWGTAGKELSQSQCYHGLAEKELRKAISMITKSLIASVDAHGKLFVQAKLIRIKIKSPSLNSRRAEFFRVY
jgi:hypothetical protein